MSGRTILIMLQTLIDTQIKKRRDAETAERDNSKFRISDAGKCHLYRYWKRAGKPMTQKIEANGYRAMELGIQLHELIQEFLVAARMDGEITDIQFERVVEDEHRLGHFDALFSINGEKILYDFKTISSKQAYFMQKNGDTEKRQHALQLMTYRNLLPYAIKQARIAYINRENLDVVADIQVNPMRWISETLKDWDTIIGAWKRDREPAANPEHWECKYCPYIQSCGAALLIV